MATKDLVDGVNDKLLRLKSNMVSNGDNPRMVALADCLIELTTDPSAPPKQAPAPAPKLVKSATDAPAATSASAPAPVATGSCTHPKVMGGRCMFCGEAVEAAAKTGT